MTESQVVNEWIDRGFVKGKLHERRENLINTLDIRFPGALQDDIRKLICQQDSLQLLADWTKEALKAYGFDQFLRVVKQ